jgi:hypothetical protein
MLFAFRKSCQYAPNAVGGGLALCPKVYNPRGCFGVTRFTSTRDPCERCHFGMPEKAAYGAAKQQIVGVEPRGIEPLTSAVQRRVHSFAEVHDSP